MVGPESGPVIGSGQRAGREHFGLAVWVHVQRRLVPEPVWTVCCGVAVQAILSIAHERPVVGCCVNDLAGVEDGEVVRVLDLPALVCRDGPADIFLLRLKFRGAQSPF